MNKKTIITLIIIAVFLFLAGFLLGRVPFGSRPAAVPPALPEDDTASYPAVVSHTAPRMLDSGYWIREGSDTLLYSPEEVEAFNSNNPDFVLYYDSARGKDVKLFMDDLPDELTNEMVVSLLDEDILKKMRSKYINGETPADGYWDAIADNCGYDSVLGKVTPVYAICLDRVVAMSLPCEDFASNDPGEIFCNDLVSAEMMPFTGAVIIHESTDGEWYYVIYGSICGWVRKEHLAICEAREEWLSVCHPENYLMVTARELILDETAAASASSRLILPMGTKIRLSDSSPDKVNGRSTLGCYVVDIPCRDKNGNLSWEYATVPVTEDVNAGPLQMTSAAVITQSFKFLGHVYGWGGSLSSNDCSGIVRQIYGCFGFSLPRNALGIAQLLDLGSFSCDDMTTDKKMELLSRMPAGTLLYMSGHMMIYLGMDEDIPYVISSCATYIDPEDTTAVDAYCIFVSGLDLLRANGSTWLESLQYMQWRQY